MNRRTEQAVGMLRSIIKKIPGARWTYQWFYRSIVGPNENTLYDLQTHEVLHRVLTADSACIDVGAHIGDILREIIAIAPKGRHHAIEALPHLASRLGTEFPGVQVHACAVSDKAGEQVFNYIENDPAYSGLRIRRFDRSDPIIRQIPVSVRCIDDLIPEDLEIRLIKMDIEGGEYHALRGAMKTLLRSKPVVIFEFGIGAADYYKVTPSMMFSLFVDDVGLNLSTMKRWLGGKPAFSLAEFTESFESGMDYYFIAYPVAVD